MLCRRAGCNRVGEGMKGYISPAIVMMLAMLIAVILLGFSTGLFQNAIEYREKHSKCLDSMEEFCEKYNMTAKWNRRHRQYNCISTEDDFLVRKVISCYENQTYWVRG